MNKRFTRRISRSLELADAEEEYFISRHGGVLYGASIDRTERWGKYSFLIIGIRPRKREKLRPYGLTAFSLS